MLNNVTRDCGAIRGEAPLSPIAAALHVVDGMQAESMELIGELARRLTPILGLTEPSSEQKQRPVGDAQLLEALLTQADHGAEINRSLREILRRMML